LSDRIITDWKRHYNSVRWTQATYSPLTVGTKAINKRLSPLKGFQAIDITVEGYLSINEGA
jgi:hypothetical protein